MMKRSRRSASPAALFVAFCAGMLSQWALTHYPPRKPAIAPEARPSPDTAATIRPPLASLAEAIGKGGKPSVDVARDGPERAEGKDARGTSGSAPLSVTSNSSAAPGATIGAASHSLRLPIDGADVDDWKGGFTERRGNRPHEAVDILAPRNTPVHAVDNGAIAKLFFSKAGGNTIYQFDPGGRLAYYYAHLTRYEPGLHDGQVVSQGDVIGYVGTSGNAPPNTPHLHFAVFELNADRRWWQGRAIDPYELFHR
jgi:peptidoglycan LD-endopeptidase LytH